MQLGPALLFAGAMNVVTGLVFRIPMPVQPMKAIAAVAIAEGLNESQILAAGIIVGGVLLILALLGWIDRLNRLVPRSVVRGLQLALGLKLLIGGGRMVAGTHLLFGWDSITMGLLCIAIIVFLRSSARLPGALVIFLIGLVTLVGAQPTLVKELRFGMEWRLPDLTSGGDWITGLWRGAIPQLPLTLLNSVIAICALSQDLFPHLPAHPRRIAISVALMNLCCCPFGAMPVCHGAGGLAGQYRFGARTGGSSIMLGMGKILLAVVFGGSLLVWLQNYPQSILGVLLACGGLELARVCRDQKSKGAFTAMILTAAACLALSTAIGFLVGWLLAVGLARNPGIPRTGKNEPFFPEV
jgi:MFS superfamily sulfate permease-like transporter